MSKKQVLNNGELPSEQPELNVASHLRSDINRLKGEFYDLDEGRVDYEQMRGSEAYASYAADTSLLREYDLGGLVNRQERLAFWVNIYNSLVIHGIIELGIKNTVKERPDFFRRICYEIGGHLFTPDDIEHGVLRGNKRPPHGIFRPFSPSDPRFRQSVIPMDVRIHFALVCASSSCPPINFYVPDQIDEQLDTAAAGFINGPEVEILIDKNQLHLSPIFKWYRPDFGGREGVVDSLIHYLDPGEAKDFLLERGMAADIRWKDYDWQLNR